MPGYYFDCERMKYPNTGLFEYCRQLGNAIRGQLAPDEEISYYIPPRQAPHLDPDRSLPQHSAHKFWFPGVPGADLWHSTFQHSSYFPRKRIPKVITIHDLNFLHEAKDAQSVKRNLKKLRRNIDRCDYLVAISKFVAADIAAHADIRGKPIEVIYNGCDVDFDPGFDQPAYRPSGPFCFCLGPTIPKKNFHVLPCLLRDNNFELVIGGALQSPYLEKIMEEAKRHGVQSRVKTVGIVSHQEKFWYYRHCEAFLFPSLAEGFGIPVIEAMHFGKPVFLSTCTSLPEVGGHLAHYFDSFDPEAMNSVFEQGMRPGVSPSRRKEIIEHASSFNWADSAKKYLNVYRKTLADSRK